MVAPIQLLLIVTWPAPETLLRSVVPEIDLVSIGVVLRHPLPLWKFNRSVTGPRWAAIGMLWLLVYYCLISTSDNVNGRALPVGIQLSAPNTIEECTSACFNAGYQFAGTEYSDQCCK